VTAARPALVLAERGAHQAEGVLGLPAGQQVRTLLPVREHAEPPLLAACYDLATKTLNKIGSYGSSRVAPR